MQNSISKKPVITMTSLALAILAHLPAAHAQDRGTSDEIVVYGMQGTLDTQSASRLGLTVLEVPATVDVIDGAAIRDRVDLSVTEAVTRSAGFTPALNPGNGHSSITARGFTGTNAVTKLYDGNQIYTIADVATFPQDTWSLERIEVLKGPSSVLYGQGGIGGAINLIPRRPEFEESSEIRVLMGENDTSFVGVDFTGGLSESVAYRFDYSEEASDNWVTNGESEREAVALALLWEASEDFSLTARYDRSDESPMAYFGSLTANGDFIDEFAYVNFNVGDAELRYEDESLRLKADWSISDITSLNVELYQMSSDRWWRNAEYYQYFESEGGVLRTDPLILGHDVEQTGLRTSFAFELGSALKALIGVETNDLSFSRPTNYGPGNPEPIEWWGFEDSIAGSTGDFDVVDPYNFQAGSLNDITDALFPRLHNWSEMDQIAFFGEAQFQMTDNLALVAGLRYEDFDTLYSNASGTSIAGSSDATTGRLGLVFDVSDTTAIYGQYATGAEHPSNSVVTIGGSFREAEMIESEQVEVGIKNAIEGTGLQWSVALFDITQNNLLIDDPDSSNPDDVLIVAEQTSTGIEAGLSYAFSSAFQVHANMVSLDAQDDSGATPDGVPELTWNAGFAWAASDAFRLVADARYVDDRPQGGSSMPSYTVLDASAHWDLSDRVNLILKGDNLTDEQYAYGSYWSGTWLIGKPRTFSVAVDLAF